VEADGFEAAPSAHEDSATHDASQAVPRRSGRGPCLPERGVADSARDEKPRQINVR
jgi:hypothetical protein